MLPEMTYWAHITGAGFPRLSAGGEQPLAEMRQSLSAALRAANPGPWLDGDAGVAQ
jgi:hypothetical protein